VKDVLQAINENQFDSLLEQVTQPSQIGGQSPSCSWKEAIAYMIAFQNQNPEKLKEVAKNLGDQFLKAKKDINSAIICYMIAMEQETVIDLWMKRALFQIRKQGVNK